MVGASSSDDKISNLDLGNPLHLQTSDFNSNTIISVKLTGTENYRAELKETYDKLDGSITFNLLQKIHNFKQVELTVSEYYHKLNLLWREFDIMTKLPKCSCAAREDVSKHNQLIKLMQFLMGLNDVFQLIRSSLLARETLPDVKDSFAIISREESHRGITSSSSSNSVTKPQVSSFASKSNSWNNNGNKKFDNNKRVGNSTNNRGPNPNLHCTNCGKVGHIVDRCFDIIGYPPGYNKNTRLKSNGPRTFNANSVSSSSKKGASLSFTNEQMIKLMNLINEAPSGNVQANMAGRGMFFNSNVFFDLNFKVFYNSNSMIYKVNLGWIIDSGANQHMTISTLNMFGVIDITYLNLTVGHPNRNLAKIKYVGNLKLSDKIVLYDVLVVPFQVTMLPSSILNGKSPFELVYGFKPKLSHLRSFGCLCFSSVLNNSDKFSSKSEKCLFDFQTSLSPNDDGRVYDTPHNDGNDHSCSSNADECENGFATSMGETSTSEGNDHNNSESFAQGNLPQNISQGQPDIGRSSRVPKMPAKFNALCGLTIVRRILEALNRNNTWTICDLPEGRKAIGSKWLWKIKYKSSGEIKRYKARVMAKGFSQREGFDYLGLYVLVKLSTVMGSNCLELLHEFGHLAAKHVDTPLPENATLNHTESDDDHLLVNVSNYQRLVGKLIYLTNTRPDIAYVVHCLSQYMHSPLNSHLDAALRVLRYLKGSPGSGIQINKTGNLKLRAYADSDWARCPATRKSVSGYCVFLGDSLVTWKSKKQSTLSRSSAEAEYRSMTSSTCEVIWLSNLLGDIGVKNLLPLVMYCDNSFALQIAANPVFHEKSKHFEIDVHLVREKVASGVIKTEKIHTTQQIADILTKGLDIEQHKILYGKLGMLDMFKLEKA
ncbi:ribonuclease H-like domain-containing protein [Tanacetum coccineum]